MVRLKTHPTNNHTHTHAHTHTHVSVVDTTLVYVPTEQQEDRLLNKNKKTSLSSTEYMSNL